MCSSPGFRKTHEYGQPFPGDVCSAEVVTAALAEDGCEVPDFFLSCPCGRGDKDQCSVHSHWAGRGFDRPLPELG